jgi:hypothetical protein
MMRQYFVEAGFEPTPAIRGFVEALTDRWPEDDEHVRSKDSPWKFPPLLGEASGQRCSSICASGLEYDHRP